MSVSLRPGRWAKAAKMVLVVALVSLVVLSVYEVANYGHEVKWSKTIDTAANDNQLGSFYSVQANNYTVMAYYETLNGYIKDGLYAFTFDGKEKWAFTNLESYGINDPTLTDNGAVYFGGTLVNETNPSFIALTPEGEVAWSYPVANGTFGSITVGPEGNIYTNHEVYVGQNYSGSEFMAFSSAGELLWKQWYQYAFPFIVSPNGTVVISNDHNLTGYSPNGTYLWNEPSEVLYYDAVQTNDTLYYTWNAGVNESGREGLRADLVASSLNGTILWRYPDYLADTLNGADMFCLSSVLVDRNGDLLFARYNGTSSDKYASLLAVSPEGNLRWEYRDSYIGALACQGDKIVITTSSGLTALDLNGHVLWKVDTSTITSRPVFSPDGTVYVGTMGKLYAVGENPIVLEVGLMIIIPIIGACLFVLWRLRKDDTSD